MKNPLFDLEFLKQLDQNRNKEVYAKINLLTFEEEPIKEIQGSITQGSINIDGTSSMRRTCSLTMVTNNVDINEIDWVLKNKFELQIGVKNTINSDYPEIIWFKQGIFVFSSISMSVQGANYTITLQGKDKACLLNGELGGAIMAITDFGTIEEYETLSNGEIIRTLKYLSIKDIIKNAVHLYAGQPLEKIILNDIDEYGKELIEYRGDKPLYMIRQLDGTVTNMIIDDTKEYYFKQNSWYGAKQLKNISDDRFWNLADVNNANQNATIFYSNEEFKDGFYLIKINQYDTCGYRLTNLTYPGELKANVGESIVSILDKIKNMFTDFEYFFDLDGRFIFQKKHTYINTSWNNINVSEDQIYVEDAAYTSSLVYSFENGWLLNSFNNQPQIANIRNDFSIWGKRDGVSGTTLPIHMRYAIDIKPKYYKPTRWKKDLKGELEIDEETGQPILQQNLPSYVTKEWLLEHEDTIINYLKVDWREIIYQMALDFYAFNHKIENFQEQLAEFNKDYYPTGKTGYENYYIDLSSTAQGVSFWRQLYNPFIYEDYEKLRKKAKNDTSLSSDELSKRLKEINNLEKSDIEEYQYDLDDNDENKYWNVNVSQYPETLNFWFDFMDIQSLSDNDYSTMSKYSIQTIGCRPKGVNDEKVKAIYYKETPNILFLSQDDYQALLNNFESYIDMTGYTFIRLTPQMENYFTISAQGKSAKSQLDSLLYQYTYAAESVTLNTVPIYYLQPNNRILIKDSDSGINGEYIISKITIPLQYNGTSSITASKAVERIY